MIFTPINCGVGGDNKESLKKKITWNESFKWKPPQYNTIDFLVRIKKDDKGIDAIYNIFLEGHGSGKNIIQYRTLELMCGFTRNFDGYMNPMLELMEGKPPQQNENMWEYKPVKFYPTNPTDQNDKAPHLL